MTLRPSGPRAKPRWAILALIVVALTAGIGGAVLASMPNPGLFELDKDATANQTSDAVGYLNTTIPASGTGGQATLNVCQVLAYGTAPDQLTYIAPAAGETILIRAERMTMVSNAAGNFGGNCAGTKRVYTVTRLANQPQQKGGDNVSARISVLRDSTGQPIGAGPDWDQIRTAVLADPTTKCTGLSLVECSFIIDGIGPSIYIGGNTKDHIDFPSWSWTTGGSPDKGEILNAYAAKAIAPAGNTEAGDQILYFGMDRWAVDGSTDIGFWFLKNGVYACPDADSGGACDGKPAGSFAGTHAIGDILILGTFTQGGATTNIRVFRWVGSGGNQGSGTVNGPDAAFGDCLPGSGSANGCATVNNSTIEVWPSYQFKGDDVSGWAPPGGFFEGGVNLSDLGLAGCFSTFIAETRSSPELTAVLKDFALGSFEACASDLSTTPGDGTAGTGNAALTDHDTPPNGLPDASIGTGSVNVRDRALLGITGVSTWNGTLKFWLCGPDDLAPTAGKPTTCSTGGTQVGPVAGDPVDQDSGTAVTGGRLILSSSASVTKAGKYCWRATFTSGTAGVPNGADSSATECFEILPVTPSLSTSATATVVSGSALDDTATLTGTANKPGSPVINPTTPGGPAGGTITFKLYGPAASATCVDSGDGANLVGSSVVNVSGDSGSGTPPKVYKASDGTVTGTLSPSAVGTYYWVASYSGDSPNTNPKSGACGDTGETSNVVNANIAITPQEATNEVGHSHVFTITTIATPAGATASLSSIVPSISPDISGDATKYSTTCDSPTQDAGNVNKYTCTVTINVPDAGDYELNATATWTFSGLAGSVVRSTSGNAGPGGSDSAIKHFVDANVAITPQTATNEVGTQHVFTITTTAFPAGATPVSLTSITPSLVPSIPAGPDYSTTCGTPVVDAVNPNKYTCTVTINSSAAGTYELNATAVWSIGGETVTRDTDTATATIPAGPGGSDSAFKDYVDANVAITPQEATNEVGVEHTFTISTEAFPAGTTASIVSIVPAITPDISGTPDYSSTCGTPTQDAVNLNKYTCTVTITSDSAGTFELNATATWGFTGLVANVVRSTSGNGGPGGSDSAVKYYVDAYITINPPTATNSVGEDHTVTVNVFQDDGRPAADLDGDGVTGWASAPDGTVVLVSVTAAAGSGAVPVVSDDKCASGTVGGACTVTFTSATAGEVVAHAATTFDVGGESLFRETDGTAPNSGDAHKTFVAGSISWRKEYADAAQGGATFTLCRTYSYDLEATPPDFVLLDDPECDTVVDNTGQLGYSGLDEDADPGEFKVSGKPLGRYEVTETIAPAGFELDPDVKIAELVPGTTNVDLSSDPFINSRPVLKITGFGYDNTPDGDQPNGILKGTTTFTVKIHNYGTADAHLTSSSLVVTDNATCDDADATPNSLSLDGITIAAGADSAAITLTCTYDHPDPAAITATLNVKYTTNSLERTASGSPAYITFTVAAD